MAAGLMEYIMAGDRYKILYHYSPNSKWNRFDEHVSFWMIITVFLPFLLWNTDVKYYAKMIAEAVKFILYCVCVMLQCVFAAYVTGS